MPADRPTIYCLTCPYTGRAMYVGKADKPKRRLRQHIRDCWKSGSPKDQWIKELARFGAVPKMLSVTKTDDWEAAETHWIQEFGGTNRLLNVALGGAPYWVDKEKKSKGRSYYHKVLLRYQNLVKNAVGDTSILREVIKNLQEMRKVAIKHGWEAELDDHLHGHFGGVI